MAVNVKNELEKRTGNQESPVTHKEYDYSRYGKGLGAGDQARASYGIDAGAVYQDGAVGYQ